MINTSSLKPNDLCWIWISTPNDALAIDQYKPIKRKAIFNGHLFITRYNNNILHDEEIFGSSVYKFKKINKP